MTDWTVRPLSIDEDLANSAYAPIRLLARGGMGEVYEVEHRELRLRRVMKLLRPTLAGVEGADKRMRAEGRVLARVKSPHLVELVDFGRTPSGRPYLVTELLHGETLGAYVHRRGRIPPCEAVDIALMVLAGLEIVHRARLVHRDIKLDNIFYCDADETGRRVAKILDFGIAKISAEDREAMGVTGPTADDLVLGTPRFMAPEQILSQPIDARADLYATGLVLFQLLTGESPFVAGSQIDLLRAQLTEVPPSVSSRAPRGFPTVLDTIVATSLAKDPRDRFSSAAEMASALRDVTTALAHCEPMPLDDHAIEGTTDITDTILDRTLASMLDDAVTIATTLRPVLSWAPAP